MLQQSNIIESPSNCLGVTNPFGQSEQTRNPAARPYALTARHSAEASSAGVEAGSRTRFQSEHRTKAVFCRSRVRNFRQAGKPATDACCARVPARAASLSPAESSEERAQQLSLRTPQHVLNTPAQSVQARRVSSITPEGAVHSECCRFRSPPLKVLPAYTPKTVRRIHTTAARGKRSYSRNPLQLQAVAERS